MFAVGGILLGSGMSASQPSASLRCGSARICRSPLKVHATPSGGAGREDHPHPPRPPDPTHKWKVRAPSVASVAAPSTATSPVASNRQGVPVSSVQSRRARRRPDDRRRGRHAVQTESIVDERPRSPITALPVEVSVRYRTAATEIEGGCTASDSHPFSPSPAPSVR